MRKKQRKRYTPPAFQEMLALPLEASLLAESAVVERRFTIRGQSSDGYYEDGDLAVSEWYWEGD